MRFVELIIVFDSHVTSKPLMVRIGEANLKPHMSICSALHHITNQSLLHYVFRRLSNHGANVRKFRPAGLTSNTIMVMSTYHSTGHS